MRLILRILVALAVMAVGVAQAASKPEFDADLRKFRRVLVLGDSITHGGQYVNYLETALRTHPVQYDVEFLNLGLPSETVSGLSEPGHAGGAFPRPDLHERLGRVLEKTKPDLVFACYGMNDGIYYPFSEERFAKFQDGILRLRERVAKAGAKIVHVTPPTFDPVPLGGRTLPAGRDAYPQPFVGYNTVLDKYSDWLLTQRTNGWVVIDAHGAMNARLAEQRRGKPEFRFAGDGVHANDEGHWVIAQQLLRGLKVSTVSSIASVDFATGKAGPQGSLSGIRTTNGELSFNWHTSPQMPMEGFATTIRRGRAYQKWPAYERTHSLSIANASAPRYDFFEGGRLLGVVTREELRGLPTRRFPELASNKRGAELLKLVAEKNAVLRDAWLSETGHKRPGMKAGLPLAEAEAKAAKLKEKIVALAARDSVVLSFRLAPSAVPFPGKRSEWNGFDRYDFIVAGKPVLVVAPKQAAPARPWVWHGEFFGHKPAPDIALLGRGFHVVHLSIPDLLGCPDAVTNWNRLHAELTGTYGFAQKPALVGLSRGGLYCYNWAIANPDKVACIYADAPVCDFRSWPGAFGKGKRSERDWQLVLSWWGFESDAEARAYGGNPVDNLAPLARARVPLLHVYGDADEVVPWEENTGLVAERYRKLGGEITLIAKPGVKHHPHGLDDPTPIVEFIARHAPK